MSADRARWIVLSAVMVALAVRLAVDIETRGVPSSRHLIGDAAGYYQWAGKIASGDWLGKESFYQAPLYAYVLGVWLKISGMGVGGIRVLQAFWGGAAVGCLAYGTVRIFGRRAGLIAGLMLALYGPAVFFDGIVQKASAGCLLVCVLVAGMGWVGTGGRAWRTLVVGVVCGLLVMTRENAIVWVVVIGLWVWWLSGGLRRPQAQVHSPDSTEGGGQGGRCPPYGGASRQGQAARWWRLSAYVVGVALVLAPVGVRNRVIGGEWSISTFQAGPNFYIGNHRGADGRYQPLVRGQESPAFERKDATRLAEEGLGRALSAREVSDYWMSRAMEDVRADPVWWLGLMGRKMLMVWNRYEVSDVESLYVYSDYSMTLRMLGSFWHFGVLCPLAAVGVASTWNERRRLWVYYVMIVSMALAVALFYVMARYRFPLVPLLIPFAAAGCVSIWRHVRERRFRRMLWWGVIALAVAVVVNWPVHDAKRLNAMAWMNVGVALAEDGNLEGATVSFRRAVEGHPESAEANNNLAQALALQGDYAGAVPHYRAALAAEPTLMGVAYNLGVALEHLGRVDEALTYYEQAVAVDPTDVDALRALERLGRREPQ